MRAYVRRLGLVLRFLSARLRAMVAPLPRGEALPAWNAMFRPSAVSLLLSEKRRLEAFDIGLFAALNDPRLMGQIAFEYGTLVNWVPSWQGMRVLDIGTGKSTLPCWMIAQGASVVAFEFPEPVERAGRGALVRLIDFQVSRYRRRLNQVAGDMLELPFADGSFDLVTCLSVIEHLDTQLPDLTFVPYPEQRRRAGRLLDEMVRVTRPGGALYLTSECCDYTRATTDAWRESYYYRQGPPLSGAWPVRDVPEIFYDHLVKRGCTLPGGVSFEPNELLGDGSRETFRGPYFSAFSVLARRDEHP
jgi:SAM-dependent methyltransferase